MNVYKILAVNPGSTSTKVAYFENEKCLFNEDVFHDSSVLKEFPTINDQLDYRMEVVGAFLKEHDIDLEDIDAIVGRGGSCASVKGGVYRISEKLIQDTRNAVGGLYHSSMLGVQMADRLKNDKAQLFMVDPTVVDELQDVARVTGVKGIYRKSACHALNHKAVVRRFAAKAGKKYEEMNLISAHIDGGITIMAHDHGRMIDGNDGGGGEGPFTPTRMGSMAITDFERYLGTLKPEEVWSLTSVTGGFSSHFQTSNSDAIHKMVEDGDPYASLIWKAMVYQCAKSIGSMAVVLKGKVDAILLTGGLMRFADIEEQIREACGWIAPIYTYAGEYEMEAMALGALRVLRGQEEAGTYTGEPVFNGFSFDK